MRSFFTTAILAVGIAACVMLNPGCSKDASTGETGGSSGILKDFPAKERSWFEKAQAKRAEFEAAKPDAQKMAKLSEEVVALEKQWEAAMQEHVDRIGLKGVSVPFEGLSGRPYSVKQVTIDRAGKSYLAFRIDMALDEPLPDVKAGQLDWLKPNMRGTEYNLSLHFKAVDSKGNEIPGTRKALMPPPIKKDVQAGKTFGVTTSLGTQQIIQMGDLAKIVEITSEEYNAQ